MQAEIRMRDGSGAAAVACLAFPFWEARRRGFRAEDPFFESGNIERELLVKHIALDLTDEERKQFNDLESIDGRMLFCPIVGCGSRLNSLEDFEDHYRARHSASCSVCSRVYPTLRLLNIHVSEAHDSFFQAKVARGFPMYECLVEGCGLKFSSYKGRQQHLVDKHKFPTTFEFFKKAHPSKYQRQKKHQRKQANYGSAMPTDVHIDVEVSSSNQDQGKTKCKQVDHDKENTKEMEVDAKVEDLISAVSRLSTSDSMPSSISFGHRHNRALPFLPRSLQRNKKVDLTGCQSGDIK